MPTLEDFVWGADFSRHSGEIEYQKVADDGVLFAGLRASVADYYIDPTFRNNYDGFIEVGVIPLPYYVVRLDYDPDAQAAKYLEALDGRKTWVDIPDVELVPDRPVSKTLNGRTLHYTMRAVEQTTYAMQMIYTAEGFWEYNMPPKYLKPFSDRPLFAASYGADLPMPYLPPYPRFPSLPDDWTIWAGWQASQRWRFPGVPSASDGDWMKAGFHRALRARSGIPLPDGAEPPPPLPPPADLEARVLAVETRLEDLVKDLQSVE